jgi:hypothetical protein
VKVNRCFAGGNHSFILLNDYLKKIVEEAKFADLEDDCNLLDQEYDLRESLTPDEHQQL